ncbi:heparin lyase I family protein [Methylobacterium sp. ID0610]|uniref:heparin lyase I family protein n=1 Tax=Methylobacterium carpenticola TaxID=3344827 RepID=UPI0036B05EF5
MPTVIAKNTIISVDDTLYNVQIAGEPWSLLRIAPNSYRFEVRAGDTWVSDPSNKNRSEIAMRSDIADGSKIGVSYTMMVEPGAANTANFTILGQFHQSESGGGKGLAPPFAIGLEGDNMVVKVAYRDATGKDVVESIFTDRAPIQRGHAYDFDIQASFDPDGSGHIAVMRDGVKIVDYSGRLGWPGQTGVYWKEGIYRGDAPETLAAVYSDLDVSVTPGTIAPTPAGPVTYNQYDGSGRIAATVTTQSDGAKIVTSFDASGALTKVVETGAKGDLTITTYGITGKSYVSETVAFDASGKIVSLSGRHGDGSLDYQQIRHADGSLDNWQYDAKGAATRHEVVAASGAREVYEYAVPGSKTASGHRSYDAQGVLRLYEQRNTDGSLALTQAWNMNGSTLVSNYAAGNVLSQTTLTRADGSRDVSDFNVTGRTYTSAVSHYDAKGVLTAVERKHADGSLDYSFVKDAGGTTAKIYNATGLLTKTEIVATSGAREVYDYTVPGSKTASGHRSYDAQGVLRLYEQRNTDGSLALTQAWNMNGSTLVSNYAAGNVLSQTTLTRADGSRDVSDFNVTGRTYTSAVSHYDAKGVLTAVERKHADGSLDYSFVKDAGGTTAKIYNAAGLLTKTEIVATSGAREVYDYTVPGSKTASGHRSYDAQGVLRLYEQRNTDGSLALTQAWSTNGSTLVSNYAAGNVLSQTTLTRADGSRDVSDFNVTGRTYISAVSHYDAKGVLTAVERKHADGSLDYSFVKDAGGTTAKIYNATGLLTKTEIVATSGAREVYDYTVPGSKTASGHRSYDAQGVLRLYEQRNTDGSLALTQAWNMNGSTLVSNYAAGNVLSQTTLTRADGSRDVSDFNVTGRTYTSAVSHYDAKGVLTAVERKHADGSLDYSFVKDAGGTTTKTYNATGLLTKTEIAATSGAREVYDYTVPGSKTASGHRSYDAQGVLRLYEQRNTDGSLDYVKTWKADGSTLATDYDDRGNFLSSASTTAAGKIDYTVTKVADGTVTKFYDAAGSLAKVENRHIDGTRDVYDYAFASRSVASVHRAYDSFGTMTLYEQWDAAGKLQTTKALQSDGSSVSSTYDPTGALTSIRTDYAVVAIGSGSSVFDPAIASTHSLYKAGQVTKTENVLVDGGRQIFDYGITDRAYVATERTYDEAGTLTAMATVDGKGNKTVTGYTADTLLWGGTGNDVFSLVNGDTVVFNAGFGNDTVRNFIAGEAGRDVLAFDHALIQDFAHLDMQQNGADTVIKVANHGSVTLQNVAMTALNQSDFAFF